VPLLFPTLFMAVVYYKIGRALIKQYRYMKRICSNPMRRSAPGSSFSILKFIRHRRTFFVCLITVLCYAIGNISFIVYLTCMYFNHRWTISFANEIYLDSIFGRSSECCCMVKFAFSKSSHIWTIGQKIAHILETLPQEKTKTTGKLIRKLL
jgi:hypothetical protein